MNVKRILGCALLGGMMVVTAACGNNSADKTITPVAQAETVNKMPNFTNAPIADEYAIFDTNYGQIKIRLYGSKAPITVKNFDYLAKKGFYNGVTFHRVIDGFMIQGGCPIGNGTGGPGYTIHGEFASNGFKNDLKHTRGVLSMARAMDPNSAGSQFFIMHQDAPHLDGEYAAFGKVIEGMENVDKIAKTPTTFNDRPRNPQVIDTITIVD